MSPKPRKTKGTPDAVDIHVGERLRVLRTLRGLSQERLAALLALTFQQIQKYERGLNRISAGRLYKLALLLGVDVNFFYEGLPPPLKPADGKPPLTIDPPQLFSKDSLNIMRLYNEIEDKPRQKAAATILKLLGPIKPGDDL